MEELKERKNEKLQANRDVDNNNNKLQGRLTLCNTSVMLIEFVFQVLSGKNAARDFKHVHNSL